MNVSNRGSMGNDVETADIEIINKKKHIDLAINTHIKGFNGVVLLNML